MAITGWAHYARDLRDERPTINAMAIALDPATLRTDVVRLARSAAFAHRGHRAWYADWRHPERPDPDLAVVVDGQLSNRRRVEEELYQRARPLSTDAEVLLHAYRAWGANLVDRIDGSYAIALWNNQTREMLLIRDPLGSSTLFYTLADGGVLFASRATALLAHPDIKPVVDSDGLNELLALGPVRTPGHAVIRGVAEVLPGELVRVTPSGVRRHRYWHLVAADHGQDLDTTVQFIRRALADNTAPLRAQRPGAVLLSGGVASAAASVFSNGLSGHRPVGWTVTLAGPNTKPGGIGADLEQATRAAVHLRLRHRVLTIDADALIDAAADARRFLDFPGESSLDAPLFAVLRHAAAAGATSVVTGDGADAVFGGYRWLRHPDSLVRDDFPWQPTGVVPTDLLNAGARLHLVPGGYRKQRYDEAVQSVPQLAGADVIARRHRTMAYLTLTQYLPTRLTRLGQLAAGARLTAHTPFADWMLAHYLFNMPVHRRDLLGVPNGLLRHTVADLLPPTVTWLRPRPFPAAHLLSAWRMSQHARLHGIVTDPNAPLHPLLDQRRVDELLDEPMPFMTREANTAIAYLIELNDWLDRHHVSLA